MVADLNQNVSAFERVSISGQVPAELIVYVAEEDESDLIIMGCRGMSTLKTFFTGTVSQYVMKNAYCPVLLCKGMPDDWDEEDLED